MADDFYRLGSEGQTEVVNRLRPISQASQYTQQYEAKQAELASYSGIDLASAENAAIAARVAALTQELSLTQDKYALNKAIVETAKAEGDVIKKTVADVAASRPKTRVISRGTPAQFVAPSEFDASDMSTSDLQGAIDYARQKQDSLIKLNPGYKQQFAKEQFLLSANGQYKGVAGISQSYVNEYLSKKKEQITPPDLVDLSKLSDEKRDKTIARARELQGQAEALAPDTKERNEKERLMILGKNNSLLMQLGLSQEYLRIAMDENTKATEDTVRGHFNLPSQYRPPTIWDYYADGGKTAGDKNFVGPNGGKEGMVPISTAQKIAEEILNNKGKTPGGPDLNALGNTIEPGSAPMFYPNPGTPSIIENLDNLDITNASADTVEIKGSSVYLNGKDITDPEMGGGRNPDWAKGMLQELAAKSVDARGNKDFLRSSMYDRAAGMIKSGELKDQASLDTYLGGQMGGITPATNMKMSDPLDAATRKTADSLGQVGKQLPQFGDSVKGVQDNTAKLSSNLLAAGAVLPDITKAYSMQSTSMGGLSKALGNVVAMFNKLDASKINLNVVVNVNGTQAQVVIQPEAPRGGTSGSALTASNSKTRK